MSAEKRRSRWGLTRSPQDTSKVGFQGHLIVRLSLVATTGYVAAIDSRAATGLLLVLVLGVTPFTILVPARWRNQVSDRWCQDRLFGLSVSVPVLAMVAAFADSRPEEYPRAALIVGAAAAHLAVIWLLSHPDKTDILGATFWSSGSLVATAGVLIDLPQGIGWHAMSFFAYGALASAAFRRLAQGPGSGSFESPD